MERLESGLRVMMVMSIVRTGKIVQLPMGRGSPCPEGDEYTYTILTELLDKLKEGYVVRRKQRRRTRRSR